MNCRENCHKPLLCVALIEQLQDLNRRKDYSASCDGKYVLPLWNEVVKIETHLWELGCVIYPLEGRVRCGSIDLPVR